MSMTLVERLKSKAWQLASEGDEDLSQLLMDAADALEDASREPAQGMQSGLPL